MIHLILTVAAISLSVPLTTAVDDGDLRLLGGRLESEGRVEVYYHGQWGTVCDDGWDLADAHVVCRSLGYSNATQAVTGSHFGSGTGQILLDDVLCLGSERSLINCKTKGWKVHDCEKWEIAGVKCDTSNHFPMISTSRAADEAEFPGYRLERLVELQQSLSLLYLSQKHCQVKILVLTEWGGPVRLHLCAHRLILSLSQDGNSLSHNRSSGIQLVVPSDCLAFVEDFIRYFYTRSMDITLASVRCVHQMASSYGVRALREACHQLLYQLLPQDSSFALQLELYSYSEAAQEAELRGLCLRYLALNCQRFSQSPAWLRLRARQLSELLLRSDLVLESELWLYRAVRAWLVPRGPGPGPGSGLTHELLGRLRYAMFSPEQLVTLQAQRGPEMRQDNFLLQRLLQAFRFHSLPVERLGAGLEAEPRIYTGSDWSALLPLHPDALMTPPQPDPSLRYDGFRYVHQLSFRRPASPGLAFSTSRFHSRYYSNARMRWAAAYHPSAQACRYSLASCPPRGYPMVTLSPDPGSARSGAARLGSDSSHSGADSSHSDADPVYPGTDHAHPDADPAPSYTDPAHPAITYRNTVLFLCHSHVALALPLPGGRASVPSFQSLGPHFSCNSGFSALRFVVRPTLTR